MIPGAEHAPTIGVGYVTEQGGFYTSIEDIPKIRRVDTGELIPDAYIEARRQLTVTDPDDQRVIWRLAALALGATAYEASTAALYHDGKEWCLACIDRRKSAAAGDFVGVDLAWVGPKSGGLVYATAALCGHLWGPKPAAALGVTYG